MTQLKAIRPYFSVDEKIIASEEDIPLSKYPFEDGKNYDLLFVFWDTERKNEGARRLYGINPCITKDQVLALAEYHALRFEGKLDHIGISPAGLQSKLD